MGRTTGFRLLRQSCDGGFCEEQIFSEKSSIQCVLIRQIIRQKGRRMFFLVGFLVNFLIQAVLEECS